MPIQWMTKAAYARHRGCDEKAVREAINKGRITLIDGKIDPEVADIQWAKNTRARAGGRKSAATAALPVTPPAPPGDQPPSADAQPSYADARARREVHAAEREALALAKESGRVIDRERTLKAVFEVFRELRDRVMAVPRRCAPSLLGMVEIRDIEHAMADELRTALSADEKKIVAALMKAIA